MNMTLTAFIMVLLHAYHFVTFDSYTIEQKGEANFVTVDSLPMLTVNGAPWIPFKTLLIALSNYRQPIRIEVMEADTVKGVYIAPSPIPVRIDAEGAELRWSKEDSNIYSSSKLYPNKPFRYLVGHLMGVPTAAVTLYPVEFNPAQHEIVFNRKFRIETGDGYVTTEAARANFLRKIVVNADYIHSEDARKDANGFDYLIVTSSSLASYWQPLVDWKTHKGHSVALRTIEWIRSHYYGRDDAERLRNYLKTALDSGLVYLLLGGDTDVLPFRKAYAMNSYPTPQQGDTIPTDLYFSDLDGTWDANNNSVFGEVDDSVDLLPDIFVGRAPVSDAQDVQNFVNKVITYESASTTEHLTRGLFVASFLDANSDGGILKDMIIGDVGDSIAITRLYERDGWLTPQSFIGFINYGYNIINHNGHGNTWSMQAGSGYIYYSDFESLSNGPKYTGVLYSLGCWVAAFDDDCIAEEFVRSPSGGGFFVGNSRYGWYIPGFMSYGATDRMDIQFFHELLINRVARLGETLAAVKSMYAPVADGRNTYRWMEYALNLLGDPDVYIPVHVPQHLEVRLPDVVPPLSTALPITVQNNDGAPVEGARVTAVQNGVVSRAVTDFNGNALVEIQPSSGQIELYVWKDGYRMFSDTVQMSVGAPLELTSVDFNCGELLLYPEAVGTLTVALSNISAETLSNVVVHLSSGNYISFDDTTFQFVAVASGDTVFIESYLSVAPDAPQGDTDNILLSLSWDDGSDTMRIPVRFAWSELSIAGYRFSEVSPCGNGGISIDIVNTGRAPTSDEWLYPVSLSGHLTLQEDSIALASMEPHETTSVTLNFNIDCSVPTPYFAGFVLLPLSDTLWVSSGYTGYHYDFENGLDGWTVESPWHITSYRAHNGSHSLYCGSENTHTYPPDFTASAISPWMTAGVQPKLKFWTRFDTQAGWDFCIVRYQKVSDTTFHYLMSFDGPQDEWRKFEIPVRNVAPGTNIRIYFTFYSENNSYQLEGWYIDDVELVSSVTIPSSIDEEGSVPKDSKLILNLKQIGNSISVSWNGVVHELSAYDAAGRNVYHRRFGSDTHRTNISMASMPSGIYFVVARGENDIASSKVVFLKR